MPTATLRRETKRLKTSFRHLEQILGGVTTAEPELLQALRRDPSQTMERAALSPDPWQRRLLNSDWSRVLILCSRQVGKSTTVGAMALHQALVRPESLVLLLSPSLRQSCELFRKVLEIYGLLGRPVPALQESALRLELQNGSRIISLPGTEERVRGYSGAQLLVIDEAARVKDALYRAVRPMLAVSQGRLVALSTAFGKVGWLYEEWGSSRPWQRVKVKAHECPRISKEFLEEERQALGPRWYAMEYEGEFQDVIGQVFSEDDIQSLFVGSPVPPLLLQ